MARKPHADDLIPDDLSHEEFLPSLQKEADKLINAVDTYEPDSYSTSQKKLLKTQSNLQNFFSSQKQSSVVGLCVLKPSEVKRSDYKEWDYKLNEDFKKHADASCKYQLSISAGADDLLDSWASLEGRSSASVATEALLRGLSAMKRDGAIPKTAIEQAEKKMQSRSIKQGIAHYL